MKAHPVTLHRHRDAVLADGPPIDTVIGRLPDGAVDGICTLSGIDPAA